MALGYFLIKSPQPDIITTTRLSLTLPFMMPLRSVNFETLAHFFYLVLPVLGVLELSATLFPSP